MNREFKLMVPQANRECSHASFLDRFLSFPKKPKYPQTKMLLHTYKQMMKVYRLDCVQGVFGVKPDGNFERLLRVSSKILLNVS